jgi:hypothetical protein
MFDFVISIVVIHYLASPSRRVRAIEEFLQLLKDTPASIPEDTNNIAKGLIYVWALEQKDFGNDIRFCQIAAHVVPQI